MKLSSNGRKKVRKTAKGTQISRKKKTKEAAPYLIELDKQVGPLYCIVCGEFFEYCLDKHHPDKKAYPRLRVTVCASCHRVFDKGGGLLELKERRKRYYKYNMELRKRLKNS